MLNGWQGEDSMNTRAFSVLVVPLLAVGLTFTVPGTVGAEDTSRVAHRDAHTWVVSPLNKSPDDAAAIQRAVNMASAGDKIVLGAGVFNFGDFDNVTIAKDLTLEGAWDRVNRQPLTIIQGGMMPLMIGRKTPVEKPPLVEVNGHKVYHITQDLWGKLGFPYLYPPYYENGQQTGVHYNLFDDWVAVNVTVRQIMFMRPHSAAIFSSGSKGGVIERCRIVSGWPFQLGIEGILGPMGGGFMFFNMGGRPGVTAGNGVLEDPTLFFGTDLISGNLLVQDNVIEGDYGEVQAGMADANGHVIAVPVATNPAPPENDYINYVLQDVPTDGTPFNLYPATPPPMYWVRKGYTAGWFPALNQVWARRGHMYSIYSLFSEATLTARGNTIHNAPWSVFFIMNGVLGKSFNASVEYNMITYDLPSSATDIGNESVLVAEWPVYFPLSGRVFTPSPGSNVTVRYNYINQSYPNAWFGALAIDLEVFGQANATQNIVKVNGGSGIGFWWPTQNGVAKGNYIAGKGDYAFYTMPGSDGNQFLYNIVNQFTPTGSGAFDFGMGTPAVPAARGVLFSDNNGVKGIGRADPLDVVYDCGHNNQITQMIATPCPASTAGVQQAQTQARQATNGGTALVKPHLPYQK
jgi:hypothetical protein